MSTEDWIAEAQKRCDNATPGRWRVWAMSVMAGPLDDFDYEKHVEVAHTLYRNSEGRPRTFDADFIAAAHQDLPRALAALRAVLELAESHERYAVACDADVDLPGVGGHWREEAHKARDEAKRIRHAVRGLT